MVQLTLPKNKRITRGKVWAKPKGAKNLRTFKIYRWNEEDGKNPQVDTYFVAVSYTHLTLPTMVQV